MWLVVRLERRGKRRGPVKGEGGSNMERRRARGRKGEEEERVRRREGEPTLITVEKMAIVG